MTPSFFRLKCLDSTNSTNVVVKEAAEAGEEEGLVVQALRQTAGKGRHGRSWESPEGNLYFSVLLRPRCSAQHAATYSFAAAMAVYEALAAVRGESGLELKWPNDVLIGGKKISGILLEAAPIEDGLVEWLVVGVGINVESHPEGTLYPATCLKAGGVDVAASDVLKAFLRSFHRWCLTLKHDGFGPVRRAWLADAKRGMVTVKTPSGEIAGLFCGVDHQGGLILRLADGTEKVIQAGDVFFL